MSSTEHTIPDANRLYIGEGVTIKGEISVPDTLVVCGVLEGDVSVGNFVVGETGAIKGRITVAENAEISGKVFEKLDVKCLFCARPAVSTAISATASCRSNKAPASPAGFLPPIIGPSSRRRQSSISTRAIKSRKSRRVRGAESRLACLVWSRCRRPPRLPPASRFVLHEPDRRLLVATRRRLLDLVCGQRNVARNQAAFREINARPPTRLCTCTMRHMANSGVARLTIGIDTNAAINSPAI
jgi:hypothetical protein